MLLLVKMIIEVKGLKNNSKTTCTVEGLCNDEDIANLFANEFEAIYHILPSQIREMILKF